MERLEPVLSAYKQDRRFSFVSCADDGQSAIDLDVVKGATAHEDQETDIIDINADEFHAVVVKETDVNCVNADEAKAVIVKGTGVGRSTLDESNSVAADNCTNKCLIPGTSHADRKRKLEESFEAQQTDAACKLQFQSATRPSLPSACNLFLESGWRDSLCRCSSCTDLLSSFDAVHFLLPAAAPDDDGLDALFPVDPDAGLSTTLSLSFCRTFFLSSKPFLKVK